MVKERGYKLAKTLSMSSASSMVMLVASGTAVVMAEQN